MDLAESMAYPWLCEDLAEWAREPAGEPFRLLAPIRTARQPAIWTGENGLSVFVDAA
jgi:hypothetical protein